MKKRRILLPILLIFIIGTAFVYAAKSKSNIEIMKQVGQLFHASQSKTDDSVFARGKSGGVITNADIEQATEFYVLAGCDRSSAREKAIHYMLQRDATYQKAVSEGYSVTDDEINAYLDELKVALKDADNSDEAQALIDQFDSEEDYWQHEFEVYKVNLPIEKYLEAMKQEYLQNSSLQADEQSSSDAIESWNDYVEALQADLVEAEQYTIEK